MLSVAMERNQAEVRRRFVEKMQRELDELPKPPGLTLNHLLPADVGQSKRQWEYSCGRCRAGVRRAWEAWLATGDSFLFALVLILFVVLVLVIAVVLFCFLNGSDGGWRSMVTARLFAGGGVPDSACN